MNYLGLGPDTTFKSFIHIISIHLTSHLNTKPLFIGKASKPCCFPNLDTDQLSVTWRHIKKSWMMSSLFTSWLSDFNRKMCLQIRIVLLFMDSAPSHPKSQTYSNVKVHFFPANKTSMLNHMTRASLSVQRATARNSCYEKSSPKSTIVKKIVRLQKG